MMWGYLLLAMLHVLASPPVTKNLIFRISNSLLEKNSIRREQKNTQEKKLFHFLVRGQVPRRGSMQELTGNTFWYGLQILLYGNFHWRHRQAVLLGEVVHSTYYMTSWGNGGGCFLNNVCKKSTQRKEELTAIPRIQCHLLYIFLIERHFLAKENLLEKHLITITNLVMLFYK